MTAASQQGGGAGRSDTSGRARAADRWSAFGSAPHASDVRLTLPARPENIAVVRHVVAALADALGMPQRMVEDMRLAVTEACTNVVRHAYEDREGSIEVMVLPGEHQELTVVVADRGHGIQPGASPDGSGPGLGLPLIAALADGLEIEHSPETGSRLAMSFRQDRTRFEDAA